MDNSAAADTPAVVAETTVAADLLAVADGKVATDTLAVADSTEAVDPWWPPSSSLRP